jgi:heavy metal sensor kinase
VSRIPVRLRLTLAFAFAMAIVLAATGAFLYVRLGASLDESVDEVLEARLLELGTRVAEGDADFDLGGATGLVDQDERFAQLVDESGAVVDGTSQIGDARLLGSDDLARARRGAAVRLQLDDVPGISGRARLLATSVSSPVGPRVLIVGASLEDRDETVRQFLAVLALVGPVALLLTSLLGYALATAALRPVESMRVEAAAISGSEPERRLPLPSAHDEIRRLGETLNEMLDRLEIALERERAFVAEAGHELRTPLAALKTELELALRRPRAPDELEHAVRSAAEETDRLVQLAEGLLLTARADRGKLPLRPALLDVGLVLADVAGRFEGAAREAGRPLERSAPPGLELRADPIRLGQALGNLVDNALRHGGGTVRLSARERDGTIELHVADEGPGFPPELLPRAFERFSRRDEARPRGGTGLGLAIVAAVATAHGGSAHARNRESGGADVWVSISKGLNDGDAPGRDRAGID